MFVLLMLSVVTTLSIALTPVLRHHPFELMTRYVGSEVVDSAYLWHSDQRVLSSYAEAKVVPRGWFESEVRAADRLFNQTGRRRPIITPDTMINWVSGRPPLVWEPVFEPDAEDDHNAAKAALPSWFDLPDAREIPRVWHAGGLAAGWPSRALRMGGDRESWPMWVLDSVDGREHLLDPTRWPNVYHSTDLHLVELKVDFSLSPGDDGRRWIPTKPLWTGLAGNTALYAGGWWLLLCGPFALRRLIRARRGRCPRCGYDLTDSPGACPECGRTGLVGRA